ncbi:MAG: MBL fold metallo-hydrolase [Candidatus Nealsonbacteria bacterium CG08_land_8_20_14_0_20_38_20]|uniref:MBL fold metallo-hydrolase n=1 Tax=Candidatus Nealsonbacteria bacterium CG08_land_8_20_14_0_20_38_20 TaxID=1974705 RepID=A0A2H0YPQ5_9BACT|nr:MAG: MBL fold metallo-hydrolase [Candidatus Nealsonbacteria bacterium CG08_land_8_20_14_0_20_38_20]
MRIKRLIVGELATNCYLLVSEKEAAVIDPGGDAEKILEEITSSGAKIKYIINTHYHPDHTLANEKISEKTGAEILIHQAEKDFINFKASRFLKEDDEIKIGEISLEVIHTPGHTKGSICLTGEDFIFTGDTLFKDGQGRTDLPGGSAEEIEESLEKLKKLFKPGILIYPGHGDIFKIK